MRINILISGDIWYNGLDQICTRYRKQYNNNIIKEDEEIIQSINKKGYVDEFTVCEDVSATEGVSFASLIIDGHYNHNLVVGGNAITSEINNFTLAENVRINIINPSIKNLKLLESEWLEELSKNDFRFSVPKNIELLNSFEFLVSRIKNYYKDNRQNISSDVVLESYLSELEEIDISKVNGSSIAFVLEVYNNKLLFMGDSIIKNDGKCEVIEKLTNLYGKSTCFDLIKLPHHGSAYNISIDFINYFKGRDYFISSNY